MPHQRFSHHRRFARLVWLDGSVPHMVVVLSVNALGNLRQVDLIELGNVLPKKEPSAQLRGHCESVLEFFCRSTLFLGIQRCFQLLDLAEVVYGKWPNAQVGREVHGVEEEEEVDVSLTFLTCVAIWIGERGLMS